LKHFVAIAFFLLLPVATKAQEWRSTLYETDWIPPHEREGLSFLSDSFIQDFSYAGYHRGERPLPNITIGIVDVVTEFGADPTGELDSTSAIQTAIDQVGQNGGGVVFLPEGTFKVSRQEGQIFCLRIRHSGVVLRGAGKDSTFIFNTTINMRQSQVIQVQGSSTSWQTQRSSPLKIARNYPGPTMEIELEDSSNNRLLRADDWVVIWQPASDDFILDLNMGSGSDGVSWLGTGSSLRGPRWLRQIREIDGTTLTLDAPTRWSINTRDSPVVYKSSDFLMEVGLENFSIGNIAHTGSEWESNDYTISGTSAWDTHDSWLIRYSGVTNAWIQNVSSYGPNEQSLHILSNGVQLRSCRSVTLYRVSMTNSQYGGGGGNGYMIRFNEANECMAVECEVGFCRHGIVQWRMENSGNVFLRNYDHDTGFQWGTGTGAATGGTGSDHHGLFSYSNLFDSNTMERSFFQAAYRGDFGSNHGMTASQVVYWNTEGREYHNTRDYIVHTQQFAQGYVIGTSGPADGVRTTENRPSSAERTNPVDFVEGIGDGQNLEPRSLYIDQYVRRMSAINASVNYTISKNQNHVKLQWRLPPGLLGNIESSDDLELWSPLLDMPDSDGDFELSLPARKFFRISVP
jgi:hypothetical protein